MKQTAVEWYTEQEIKLTLDFLANKINQLEYGIKRVKLIQQAKEMEKEQIIEAYDHGEWNQGCNGDAKRYYIETYESNT
jgi:hypothetical protein